ncbi:MAG: hypothetical protein JXA11_10260 [Phycisphaerae bacterium]|nr:hypothetical protein [Phycisphaerae bacterium]
MRTLIGIDVANNMHLGCKQGFVHGESYLRELVRKCADCGIETLYWRVSEIGRVTYRSNVRTRVGSPPKNTPYQEPSVMDLILKQCDPLEVGVEEAHRCGLNIFAYVTLFDEYYPGMESDFEVCHPEYTWKHLSQNHHVRGLLSYAYPEVRQHRLAEIRELIEYGVDGIYLDTARSHSGIQPILALPLGRHNPHENYGYNEIEVEAFREETGLDPLRTDRTQPEYRPVYLEEYHKFRGRYLTRFLREVRQETNRKPIELSVGFYTDAACYLSPAGQRGRSVMGRFHHDYETWVDEDLIDSIVLIAEHRRFGARDWVEHSRDIFEPVRKKGKKIYLWAATEAVIDQMEDAPGELPLNITVDREMFLEGLRRGLGQCYNTTADGVYFYEAYDQEKFQYWDDLRTIVREART